MASTEELLKSALEQNQMLLKQLNELMVQNKLLSEQIAYLSHKMYGSHSEKLTPAGQTSLFTEPEQTGFQSEEPEVVSGDQVKTRKPKRKRTEIIGSNLPVQEEVFRRLSDKCEHGHQLDTVGKHFVGEEVRMIPGRLYVAKMYQETYKCPECEKADGDSHMYQAPAPKPLIAHSIASASLVSEVVYQKYVLGTPLYRQMGYWKNQGLALSDKTMANWMILCAQTVQPVYNLLHEYLVHEQFLQGDETPYQVLQEPGKSATSKSYIWLARTIGRAKHQVVYYHYAPSRGGKVAQSLYAGFTGVLQCDGYYGYNAISDSVEHVGCWAHVRRKFYDDANVDKKHFNPSVGLKLINAMSLAERKWKDFSADDRLAARQRELKPLIEQFWTWCDQVDVLPKSRLGKALAYAQGQRAALNRVLLYGEMDFTNNASERNMKSYVIGRKNWLFSTSQNGAEANVIWMTLIESAKANGINPHEYIQFLLETVPQLPTFAKKEQLEACLPWNFEPNKVLTTKK